MVEIKMRVEGVDRVRVNLKGIPAGGIKIAMKAIATYTIGDGQRGLRRYPPYRHVTRRQAYGKPFVSDRQRRYVMAAIKRGEITPGFPRRTGRLQRAWKYTHSNQWKKVTIRNDEPYAQHVMGINQARLNTLVGWRKAIDVVQSNIKGAVRSGQAAVNAWIRKETRK